MIADRNDIAATLKAKHDRRAQEIMPMVRMVAGAAPVMARLMTQDENWNRYVTYLQGMVERTAAARDAARAKLNDPNVLEHAAMLKLKFDAAEADAMVRAWQLAIEIPRAVLEGGEEAEKIIANFEKKNEAQTP